MDIQIIKTATGFAVKFPFILKNAFRDTFKSAKWNSVAKQWEVGSRSGKRLEQWVATVKAENTVEKLEASDEKEMSENELAALKNKLQRIAYGIDSAKKLRDEAEENKAEAALIVEKITAMEAELAEIAQQRQAIEDALQADRAKIEKMVSAVVDIAEIRRVTQEMKRHWRPTAAEHDRFNKSQARMVEIKHELAAANLRSELVNNAVGVNFNRPDRDSADLDTALTFQVLEEE